MAKMTGGQAVVKSLIAEGVDAVFGIPGAHAITIYDALYDHPQLRHILARHEQGAAYMADGYARASGRPGVCITTTGPGAFNSLTAMAEAYTSSSPVLNITTQIHSSFIGKDKGAMHESRDQLGMFRHVTGWNKRVESIKDIPLSIHEAFRLFKTQRPRPIELEFPVNILDGSDEVKILKPEEYEKTSGEPSKVKRAADMLARSKKVVILAGGGVLSAGAFNELTKFAELLQAPVLTTGMGKTVMTWEHPLYLGCLGRGTHSYDSTKSKSLLFKLIEEADAVVAVGTKLGVAETINWTLPFGNKLIHINIDETEFGKNYPCKVAISGDAKLVLKQLIGQLSGEKKRLSRSAEVANIKTTIYQNAMQRAPVEIRLMEDIRAAAGPEAIISVDIATVNYWARVFLKQFSPRTEIVPYGFFELGFALPAAIGAKVACPQRPVIVLVGDGGFQFTMQELATAAQFGINVKVIIFNDNCYGILKNMQKHWLNKRYISVDLVNPDFIKLAKAYDIQGTRVSSMSGVKRALKKAMQSDKPGLIEVSESPRSSIEDSGA